MKSKYGIIILLLLVLAWSFPVHARFTGNPDREPQIKAAESGEPTLSRPEDKDKSKSGMPEFAKGEVLVKFKKGVSPAQVRSLASSASLSVKKEFSVLSKKRNQCYMVLSSPVKSTAQLVELLSQDKHVESVSPNYIRRIDAQNKPNDSEFGQLWGMHNEGQYIGYRYAGMPDADIDAPEAWAKQTGSANVVLVSLDTGVDYTHVDLSDNMWRNPGETGGGKENDGIDNDGNGYIDDVYGWDAYNDDGDPMDGHGHGTHTSGTMAAKGNNGFGVAGVNWNARVMALKFLSDMGWGFVEDEIECFQYILAMKDRGINIIAVNASYGSYGYSQLEKDAIEELGKKGIILVAAAGNAGEDTDSSWPHYPSCYDLTNIISVGASDPYDDPAGFSNYGRETVDLFAPGVAILSTLPGIPYVPNEIFYNNMESGLANWTITRLNGNTGSYVWEITEEKYFSPSHSLTDSRYDDYTNNTHIAATMTSAVDLTSYSSQNISFGFMAAFDIEAYWDNLYIEFSNDNGATWETVYALTGWQPYFYPFNILIDDYYKTSQFKARFVFGTDSSVAYDGVYIDDVGIGYYPDQSTNMDYWSGTSMAAPHVTGAVGLVAAQFPTDSMLTRVNRILSSVDKMEEFDWISRTGGRLDVSRALDNSIAFLPLIDTVIPSMGLEIAKPVTITGMAFGDEEGDVVFSHDMDRYGSSADIISWSDTQIVALVPIGGAGRYVSVITADDEQSNVKTVTSWERKKDAEPPRDNFGAAVVSGKVYVFGGYIWGGWTATDTAAVYDPATDTWDKIAPMPAGRRALLDAAELNGKIYIVGGYNDETGTVLKTVEVYNPDNNTYARKADLPYPMAWMRIANLNNTIYLTGGRIINGSPMNKVFKYDAANDEWIEVAAMNEPRAMHGMVALNNRLYVFGGADKWNEPTDSAEVYDPDLNRWSYIADMPDYRMAMGAVTDGMCIHLIGGSSGDWVWYDSRTTVMRYDPQTDGWMMTDEGSIRATMFSKTGAPAVYVTGKGVYSLMGYNADTLQSLPYVEFMKTLLDAPVVALSETWSFAGWDAWVPIIFINGYESSAYEIAGTITYDPAVLTLREAFPGAAESPKGTIAVSIKSDQPLSAQEWGLFFKVNETCDNINNEKDSKIVNNLVLKDQNGAPIAAQLKQDGSVFVEAIADYGYSGILKLGDPVIDIFSNPGTVTMPLELTACNRGGIAAFSTHIYFDSEKSEPIACDISPELEALGKHIDCEFIPYDNPYYSYSAASSSSTTTTNISSGNGGGGGGGGAVPGYYQVSVYGNDNALIPNGTAGYVQFAIQPGAGCDWYFTYLTPESQAAQAGNPEAPPTWLIGNYAYSSIDLPGDRDYNYEVTIDEVQWAINMFIKYATVDPEVDTNNDKQVTIDEVMNVIDAHMKRIACSGYDPYDYYY